MTCWIGGFAFGDQALPKDNPGAAIYQKLCVDCHGAKGEGVKDKADDPLRGTRSLESLAKKIDKTMPEDHEELLNADESAQVAAFIFDAFYSPAAQARNNPAHRDLMRLTVSQYQNSVTDLVGQFRGGFDRPPGAERGLKAHYSGPAIEPPPAPDAKPEEKKKEEKKDKPKFKFDRVDPQISFNFAEKSPEPEKIIPEEFSIRWDGALIAPETGNYEFILKTENGARLFINDKKDPLIDGWVSSGPDVREEKKSIFLLGGRSYPIFLEFFKFKEKTSSLQLLWKPPHGAVEPVPTRVLSPNSLPQSMIVSTNFPADDRSDGYERGTGISKTWDQATTEAAIEVVGHVEKALDDFSGSKPGTPERADKLKEFCRRFVEIAFRHPLNAEERQQYIEAQFQKAATPELAVKRVILRTLKSPRFLYPEIPDGTPPNGNTVATRLAILLWDSIPDSKLTKAANEGKLATRELALKEASRMAADQRTRAKLHGFFNHWLELDRAESASKDPATFPGFDASTMADLRTSLWMLVDQVLQSEKADYRELLQSDSLYLNERLAKFYGKEVTGSEFQKVAFDPSQRSGVLTHPYLLSALAYSKQSSPIHRGVFLMRNIAGLTLNPPPAAVQFEDSHFDPSLTMREKVVSLTKNQNCMSCHGVINPLGFSLENFDAIGRWRTEDNHKPIDAASTFECHNGQNVSLNGPRDMAKYAVNSPDAHRVFIRQLFQHIVKQPVGAYGSDQLEKLRSSFENSGYNIQKLLVEIAVTAATYDLPPPPAPQPTPPPAPAPPLPAQATPVVQQAPPPPPTPQNQ